MNRETLIGLAERCERASGHDVTLTKEIFCTVYPEKVPLVVPHGQYGWHDDTAGWWLATGEDARCPPKTIYPPNWLTSLDAAMTLVPEGFGWRVEHVGNGRSSAIVGGSIPSPCLDCATPALALCAAALRARAATVKEDGDDG